MKNVPHINEEDSEELRNTKEEIRRHQREMESHGVKFQRKMTTIEHNKSVEVKTFKANEKNAEHFNPLKPPRKDVHVFYVGKVSKEEGT